VSSRSAQAHLEMGAPVERDPAAAYASSQIPSTCMTGSGCRHRADYLSEREDGFEGARILLRERTAGRAVVVSETAVCGNSFDCCNRFSGVGWLRERARGFCGGECLPASNQLLSHCFPTPAPAPWCARDCSTRSQSRFPEHQCDSEMMSV
jgi:hypothetical protein